MPHETHDQVEERQLATMKDQEMQVHPGLPALNLPLRSWRFFAAGIVLATVVIVGGCAVAARSWSASEAGLAATLSAIRVPALENVALFIHYGFEPMINCGLLATLCFLLLWPLRDPLKCLAFGSIAAIGWVSSELGKIIVSRPRPPSAAAHSLIRETASDSFPSGHTAFVFSLTCAVIIVLCRPGFARRSAMLAGTVLVIVVATSRVYIGVHYPTDVIGSVLLSSASIMLWLPLWNKIIEPQLRRWSLIEQLTSTRPVRHA